MGFPRKLKFPIISNDFANCGHKGELSAVFSAIYYLNSWFKKPFILSRMVFTLLNLTITSQFRIFTLSPLCSKSDSAFACISAHPLLEPLLNMHTASYMSAITYLILRAIPAIHEINALREVSWQRVGKFLFKSTIALCCHLYNQNIGYFFR